MKALGCYLEGRAGVVVSSQRSWLKDAIPEAPLQDFVVKEDGAVPNKIQVGTGIVCLREAGQHIPDQARPPNKSRSALGGKGRKRAKEGRRRERRNTGRPTAAAQVGLHNCCCLLVIPVIWAQLLKEGLLSPAGRQNGDVKLPREVAGLGHRQGVGRLRAVFLQRWLGAGGHCPPAAG